MTKSHYHRPATEDIDTRALGRALWRAKGGIVALAIMAGLVTFIGLSMMRPLYTSEARILIENDQSAFALPASDRAADVQRVELDEQAVQSEMQVLTSRDLAVEVVRALDLTNNPDFAEDARVGPIERLLNRVGLGLGSPKSGEEEAVNALAEHLDVFQLVKSSAIAIDYASGDATLAAKIANQLADSYIEWQRKAKLEQTKDATAWLSTQIEVLRRALEREAEAQRDLIEAYLARYRDASAPHDMGAVPAEATIVSRAHASVLPSFPKRGPITLLVTLAAILLALAYALTCELIRTPAEAREEPRVKPRAALSAASADAGPSAGEMSEAAFLLDRLRRGETLGPGDPDDAETQTSTGLLGRLWRELPPGTGETRKQAEKAGRATLPKAAQTSPLRANDLRHYLNQRIAAAPSEAANDSMKNAAAPSPKPGQEKAGLVVKSLDAVLTQILAASKSGTPQAVLVAGASANVDATAEVIHIARLLVAQREQVVLIDVTRGASAVSSPLGLPRAPGFTDLAAGRASFEEIVKLDNDTPLQVIAAGNPKATAKGDETERFTQLFEAVTLAYDCVVLHADRDTVRKLTPALKFKLSVVVAVLPLESSGKSTGEDLADFSALGCPVVAYEQSGKEPRSGLLARVAAI